MNAAAWIAVAGAILTLILNVAGYLVAWGVMKGTIKALGDRLTAVEGEAKAIGEIKVELATVKAQLAGLLEQFKDLNASIRWMRDPAEHGQQAPRSRKARP